jgi:hypothetical protein
VDDQRPSEETTLPQPLAPAPVEATFNDDDEVLPVELVGTDPHQHQEVPQEVPTEEFVAVKVSSPVADDEEAHSEAPADDADDEADPEPWGGEYKGNPNVKEDLKIIEPLSDEELKNLAKNGSLLLSNLSVSELNLIHDAIQVQISAKQAERQELAEKGIAQGYYAIEADLPDGSKNIIFVTEHERRALTILSEYEATLRQSADDDLFDDSEWTNRPTYGDVKVIPGRLDHSKHKDPVLRIQGKLGLATSYSTPFWGSGIHLVIEGGAALDELSLNERILQEKSESGRLSSGYIYGAGALYLVRPVVDYVLGQVKSSTAGVQDPDELKNLMLITDIEPMATAMAATMYPDGYLLERPCLTTQGGCGNIERGRINLRRMVMVRRSKITDDQMQFMTKRSGYVDPSRIREYQKSIRAEVSRLVELDAGLFLRLRVPTIADYERLADSWLQTMDARARQVSRSGGSLAQRQAYMLKAQNVAVVMAYGHWIDGVLEKDDEDGQLVATVERYYGEDAEERFKADKQMDRVLESLAKRPDLTDKISNALRKFISDMTLSTPTVPKTICSQCGKPVSGDETSTHPHLVNVNSLELFFTLLHQRILRRS